MSQRRWVGTLGSVVVLVGFASTANASATIDLLWSNGQSTVYSVTSSSFLTLDVVLTAGANGSNGAMLSVEFDDNELGYYSSANAPTDSTFSVFLWVPTYNGSNQVNSITVGALPPYVGTGLAPFESHLIGTVKFHARSIGITGVDVAFVAGESVLDGGGNDITSSSTFNGATVWNAMPEPGTVSLVALGLCGLALAGRR